MTAAAASHITPSRWADLPPDLLGDVTARLHDAVDFVRVHAICTPWRESLLSLTTTRPCRLTFPPCLLVPCKGTVLHSLVDFGRFYSKTAWRSSCDDAVLAEPPDVSFAGDNNMTWVASADGTGVWLFTNTRLLNVLTGAVTRLPRFPEHDDRRYKRRMENLRGIFYGDGTVFLYSVVSQTRRKPVLTAAILRPNDTAWRFVKTRINLPASTTGLHSGAMYHDGKILVCVSCYHQFLLTLDDGGGKDHKLQSWYTSVLEPTYMRDSCYVLESRGELLLVSVLLKLDWFRHNAEADDPAGGLSLMVQALEEEAGSSGKMRWVARDGRGLGDRILFLGFPASFAADAVQLGVDGGCAYFVFMLALFRYNLVAGEAKLVKRLSPVCATNKAFMWLQPHPAIASIREIRDRIEAPKKRKRKPLQIR